VRPVRDVGVAHEAYLDRFVPEQSHFVRGMGGVAGQALAGSNRRMDRIIGKAGLVMAGKA
jgi:hypothetical protein